MKTLPWFDLAKTYAIVEDGGAAPTIDAEQFWRQVMGGTAEASGVAQLADADGWLAAIYDIEYDTPNWEMHPAGDELLFLLSGEIGVVFENTDTDVLELRSGNSCIVPRGVWHRQIVREPGRELAITYGKGTQHRQV